MSMSIFRNARIVQNAYVVNDLEQACRRWNRIYGIGPFVGARRFVLHMNYRGQLVGVELAGVFAQSGGLVIELLQQLNDVASPFRELFPIGREGFHHVAAFCDDYAATRDRARAEGFEIAGEFEYAPGCTICYIDAVSAIGHMIELYTEHPLIRGLYEDVRTTTERWDGANLIQYNWQVD